MLSSQFLPPSNSPWLTWQKCMWTGVLNLWLWIHFWHPSLQMTWPASVHSQWPLMASSLSQFTGLMESWSSPSWVTWPGTTHWPCRDFQRNALLWSLLGTGTKKFNFSNTSFESNNVKLLLENCGLTLTTYLTLAFYLALVVWDKKKLVGLETRLLI